MRYPSPREDLGCVFRWGLTVKRVPVRRRGRAEVPGPVPRRDRYPRKDCPLGWTLWGGGGEGTCRRTPDTGPGTPPVHGRSKRARTNDESRSEERERRRRTTKTT